MKQIWLRLEGREERAILASYFFHGRGKNVLEKSPLRMLRFIVYQLLDQDPDLCDAFLPVFLDKKKKHGGDVPWYLGELKSFLLSSVRGWGSTPGFLLVDALDECLDEEVQSVVTFLESLAQCAIDSDKRLNVCLASRHYPQIRMGKLDELAVAAQSEHDDRDKLTFNEPDIEEEIIRKADHVFLWVELVVKILNEAYNSGRVRAMKKVLREIPSDLKDLYSELLSKGRDSEEIKESVLVLQWVLFAVRELSSEELYFAVMSGTDPDQLAAWNQEKESYDIIKRYITTTSKSLIEILNNDDKLYLNGDDESHDQVQFIHESVKDFLLGVKGLQSLDSSLNQQLIGSSHNRLAMCCWTYIMTRSLEILDIEDALDLLHDHLRYASLRTWEACTPF